MGIFIYSENWRNSRSITLLVQVCLPIVFTYMYISLVNVKTVNVFSKILKSTIPLFYYFVSITLMDFYVEIFLNEKPNMSRDLTDNFPDIPGPFIK